MRELVVSRASAGFVQRGHPWVRPDRFTRGLDRLRAGEAVTLVGQDGKRLASALAEPGGEVCARVYHRQPDRPFDPAAAMARAWERRAALHADPETDCYRIVHGEGDFLPGIRVERLGRALVVLAHAGCALPHADSVETALVGRVADAVIAIREHRDDLRRAEVATRLHGGGAPEAEAIVEGRELGVRYPLRPFAGLATGLYVDQRATRVRLRQGIAGKRVLNLFAYTGAFSLALLQAGAAHATDVDLSAPSLARATEAAALNGLSDRHAARHEDCRRFLAAATDAWDVIVCDPPTAAQGGEGWVLRRDYPEVLRLACSRLAPGGLLVACVNTVGGKPFPLREEALAAAQQARIDAREEPGFALGDDLPQLSGFPEGRPYRLVAIRRER